MPDIARRESNRLVAEAVGILRGTRVLSPIEYGRAVHAEMSAIMDAARRGVSVRGATLYTSTFPCHECARHIITAGIDRVYYIEPYPKSLALDLHKDAVSVETDDGAKVAFLPFVGVAPRQYMNVFGMKTRKDESTGKMVSWIARTALPVQSGPFKSYFEAEDWIGAELQEKMTSSNLVP
ncbi:MAG: deaminase [Gemmatimonadaceae bacterium]